MSKYNFSPGPAKLNKSVLEVVENNILEYETQGVSILEISHRSPSFQNILDQTKNNLQNLFAIPKNYKILFLHGIYTLFFIMIHIIHSLSQSRN